MKNTTIRIAFIVAIFSVLSGCASQVKPAQDSGYLTGSEILQENRERFPFQKVWVNQETDKDYQSYKKIYVAPVNTSYLDNMEWFKMLSEDGMTAIHNEADRLAVYLQNRLIYELENSQGADFTVIKTKKNIDSDTAILEFALVELIPSPAQVNRFTSVAGFFIPFLGTASSLVVEDGSIAIEAKMTNYTGEESLLLFADREEDKSAILVDVNDLGYFKHAEKHIETWAYQYALLLSTDMEVQIKDQGFKLKPW